MPFIAVSTPTVVQRAKTEICDLDQVIRVDLIQRADDVDVTRKFGQRFAL
ncbi:MAG: hypothetical protein U0V48_15250 [Anaerolineales bacterium]